MICLVSFDLSRCCFEKKRCTVSVARLTTFPLTLFFADDAACSVTCTTDFISKLNCSNSDSAGTASCDIVADCRYRSSTLCSYFWECESTESLSGLCYLFFVFFTCYFHWSTYCLISTFHVSQGWIFCRKRELQYQITTILVHNGTRGCGWCDGVIWYQLLYHSNTNGQTRQYGDPDKALLWICFIQI